MTIEHVAGKIKHGDALELERIAAESSARDENEADTRHRIIDFILHNLLEWPRNRVRVEDYIGPGFADYVLVKQNDDPILFVEAKRSGLYFVLPHSRDTDETSCYIMISKLLSDPNTRTAMTQVRTYCQDTGCEFAAVTNGHEWIFFKVFEKGKRWESLQAFVIRSIAFFSKESTKSYNTLGYISITEKASLFSLLTSSPPQDRNIYYAKDRIAAYAHTITANKLASTLRPVVNHYFGVIGDDDTEFMDRCYVSQRDYQQTFEGVRGLIADSISPYFRSYGVEQLEDTGRGGRLGGRLTRV
jgi:predicted type IV restriction endonuclease